MCLLLFSILFPPVFCKILHNVTSSSCKNPSLNCLSGHKSHEKAWEPLYLQATESKQCINTWDTMTALMVISLRATDTFSDADLLSLNSYSTDSDAKCLIQKLKSICHIISSDQG